MKLTKYISLVPYRIPINSSLLQRTADEMLEQAGKVENLVTFLGWEEMPPELITGFDPQRNAKEFLNMLKQNQKRKELKAKRVKGGYADLISERKGVKGWAQKKRDDKELDMPLGYDMFIWLRESVRLGLLTSLHDALLGFCSSAEPRQVNIDEVTETRNAFCLTVSKNDTERANQVVKALSSPLKSVDPNFIIDFCPGYVVHYDVGKGVAYYFGEPY
ncbi:MAG: hypothetical protein AAF558_12665 [Verrucomicrobiota bacterium]